MDELNKTDGTQQVIAELHPEDMWYGTEWVIGARVMARRSTVEGVDITELAPEGFCNGIYEVQQPDGAVRTMTFYGVKIKPRKEHNYEW